MKRWLGLLLFPLACAACAQRPNEEKLPEAAEKIPAIINPQGKTVAHRFNVPPGFTRTTYPADSFGTYLRQLPLKPHGELVKLYDGRTKSNEGIYAAVVDKEIGKKDLHQCADAVMRLRAEYLFDQQAYDKIHFNFTNGFRVDYSEWMNGKRMVVDGNRTFWRASAPPSNTGNDLNNYMELIFTYAGTESLEPELEEVPLAQMQIGDVFIQGGSPGHAVIVVDMAENRDTRDKVFLLAQSYMPAQEIQVLLNPANNEDNPWYTLDSDPQIETPEWTFNPSNLKRFRD